MRQLFLILFVISLGACASQPEEIPAHDVSTLQYRDYDCSQLSAEATRVSGRVNELHGSLEETADNDAAQMGVGMILFWPALFFLEGGDGPEAHEYARLKGERNAIEQVATTKKCVIDFEPLVPASKPEIEVEQEYVFSNE